MSTAGLIQGLKGPTCAALLGAIFASSPAQGGGTQQSWIEITSPHFVVVSNAGEKKARDVAQQFEQFRSVYQTTLPKSRVDPARPMIILAVRSERDLQELLPQYWERQGQFHFAGRFQSSFARHYVALRLDVIGASPYILIYHEYIHLLNRLNIPRIPMWLDEGLAEFWGNTRIEGGVVKMGFPSRVHLQFLRAEDLIPLGVLFTLDRSSPYCNDADKVPLFYAQSWALTHYLMIGDGTDDARRSLTMYMNLVQTGHDPVGAARRAFGSLTAVERKLEDYVRRSEFTIFRTEAPAGPDPTEWKARELSPSESLSLRGDFLLSGDRPRDARPLLREALDLDPNSAHAHESMGLLCYREGRRDEAAKWLGKAVDLDPQRFRAHYLLATLRLRKAFEDEELKAIAQSLRRAIELNPDFRPAYVKLMTVYQISTENLEEALALAQKAVDLEPAKAWNYVRLGQIRMMMGETDEARKLVARARRLAKSTADEIFARVLLERVEEREAIQAWSTRKRPAVEPEDEAGPRSRPDEAADEAGSQETLEPRKDIEVSTASVQETAAQSERHHQEVRGILSFLQCLPGGALNYVLSVGDQKFVLRASSQKSVLIFDNGKLVSKSFRCGPLHAQVIAHFVPTADAKPGSKVEGTLTSLELSKQLK